MLLLGDCLSKTSLAAAIGSAASWKREFSDRVDGSPVPWRQFLLDRGTKKTPNLKNFGGFSSWPLFLPLVSTILHPSKKEFRHFHHPINREGTSQICSVCKAHQFGGGRKNLALWNSALPRPIKGMASYRNRTQFFFANFHQNAV